MLLLSFTQVSENLIHSCDRLLLIWDLGLRFIFDQETMIWLFHLKAIASTAKIREGKSKEKERERRTEEENYKPATNLFFIWKLPRDFSIIPLHIQIDPAQHCTGTGRSAQSRLPLPLSTLPSAFYSATACGKSGLLPPNPTPHMTLCKPLP